MTTSSGHTLTFSQLVGTFTVDKELLGKQDPYVLFQSGHAKVQTKAIKNNGTATAEWRESYTLENFKSSSSSVLEVTVYNHNTLLPDSQIGGGTLDLSTLGGSSLSGSGDAVTVNLTDKKGKDVGNLRFYINGGGYTGRGGSSGTGTGSGYSSGVGSAAGVGGAGATGAGLTGGHHGHHGSGGTVVGAGKGTSQTAAQEASDKAARVGHDTTTRTEAGTGTGRPVNQSVGTGTGVTGHHHDHSHTHGTGVTGDRTRGVGTGSGVTGVGAGEHSYGREAGEVIDRKYYTGTEERAQDQALIEQYREHNPYAKDYETTVQHTGRERLVGSNIEALGTRERVIGEDHHVHSHPTAEIARNLPAGAIENRPGGEGWVQNKPGPVCDTNTFSIAGDRTVDKERVTDLRENREFEKEFEVKTKLVGERQLDRDTPEKNVDTNLQSEILNRERVLVDEDKRVPCVGHPTVGSHNSGSSLTGSGTGTRGVSGTGSGVTGSGTHHSGTHGVGTGSGLTGTGVGSGTGTHGVGSGTGTHTGTGTGSSNRTIGEKAASFIPGSEENREKKLEKGQY